MKSKKIGYAYILPAIIFLIIFVAYPIIYNILLSFQHVDLMALNTGEKNFVGLANYKELFNDPTLMIALKNTLFFTIMCISLQFLIGFAFALFFNLDFGLSKFIRGLIMVSWLIPVTVTTLNFKYMFSIKGGIINELLLSLHLISSPIEWLVGPNSAMWALIITNVWIGVPFNMILLVAGLSTISNSLYEAASIDGANWFQQLIYITIPSIKSAIFTVLTLGFIYTFKVFDLVFLMTGGGPVNATEVLSTMSYRYSFTNFDFSKGAAIANIMCIILLIISLIYIRIIKKSEV